MCLSLHSLCLHVTLLTSLFLYFSLSLSLPSRLIQGLLKLPYIDVAAVEAGRMFDSLIDPADSLTDPGSGHHTHPSMTRKESLSTVLTSSRALQLQEEVGDGSPVLRLDMLEAGVTRWKWLRSMLKVRKGRRGEGEASANYWLTERWRNIYISMLPYATATATATLFCKLWRVCVKLCFANLCHAILCRAMPCYAMLCVTVLQRLLFLQVFSAFQHSDFTVCETYDYSLST